jgi:L-amino acid N-acyltransferase YncA
MSVSNSNLHRIRLADVRDVPLITEIYNEAVLQTTATFDTEVKTIEDRTQWLKNRHAEHPVFVCESDSTVVGWGALGSWSDRAAYNVTVENSVYVLKSHQGKGIGRLLLKELISSAKKSNKHSILARIADNNKPSISLHLQAGFKPIGTMKEVGYKFNRLIDVSLLQLML